jgi:hypothetical protein
LFDGHQGVRAALRAKEVVPELLSQHLLSPAAPPPPPLRPATPATAATSAAAGKQEEERGAAAGHIGGLILGKQAGEQAGRLRASFLEADARIALDEGCTATVLLLERHADGRCVLQVSGRMGWG